MTKKNRPNDPEPCPCDEPLEAPKLDDLAELKLKAEKLKVEWKELVHKINKMEADRQK